MSDPQDRRMPPRFVPTLTEVVGEPDAAPLPAEASVSFAVPVADPAAASTDLSRVSATTPTRVLPTESLMPAVPLRVQAAEQRTHAADLPGAAAKATAEAPVAQQTVASAASADAVAKLSEADLASVVTRLVLRSDFQDKLAQAVATVVAQQVHAQLSGQVATLTAKLPELVERAVQDAITKALNPP